MSDSKTNRTRRYLLASSRTERDESDEEKVVLASLLRRARTMRSTDSDKNTSSKSILASARRALTKYSRDTEDYEPKKHSILASARRKLSEMNEEDRPVRRSLLSSTKRDSRNTYHDDMIQEIKDLI